MTYTPINWQTGDTITADKMNKMDNGWSVESAQLFSETVTAVDQGGMYSAQLAYSGIINADAITVTFDGTEYECSRIDAFGEYFYGGFSERGPNFTNYPFAIESNNGANKVYTETASAHTIAVSIPTIQTSTDFDAARGWSYDAGGTRELFSETVTTVADEYAPDDPAYASLTYSTQITAGTLIVTFDGVDYTCQKNVSGTVTAYGGISDLEPDFTDYPFAIVSEYFSSGSTSNTLYTEIAGTHTIAVVGNIAPSAKASKQFKAAVGAIGLLPFICEPGVTTYAEMRAAADAGSLLYFYTPGGDFHLVISFSDEVSATAVTAYPEGVANIETYGFNSDMVFYVALY